MVIFSPILDGNVSGWNELLGTHNPVYASYAMFNASDAFNGFFVVALFFVFQIMLYQKTKSTLLGFIITIMFMAMWLGNIGIINQVSVPLIFLVGVIQLGVILYNIFWRRD